MQAADGAREELRHRVRLRVAGRGAAHRADPAHRRPRRRRVDSRRRQGQSDRPHAVARQGRAHARRAHRRGRQGHRRDDAATAASPASRGRAATSAARSPARRSSTAPASGRASSARLAGVNVPLYAAEHFYIVTEADRRRHARPAGDPRSRRLHLLQGGSRRPRDGRLRARRPSRGTSTPIPDGFEFQLLPEDWDQFEILMTNAIHRTPCLETAQVKMLLNGPESFTPRRQLHPRRSARARAATSSAPASTRPASPTPAARARLDRRVDRRRRGAARPVGRRHPPLRAVPRQPPAPRRPHRRVARPALRDALAARGARRPCGRCAARRSTTGCGEGRGVRQQDQLGARQLLPAARARPSRRYTLDTPGWLPLRARRAARVPRGRRRLRPDVVRQIRAEGPRRARRAAAPVRERDRRAGRPDGLHGDAQRARRLRERPDDHARSRRDDVLHPHRLGADDARLRVDRAPHRRRRARGAGRRHQRVLGAVGDGAEGARRCSRTLSPDDLSKAGAAVRARRARSTSATRACAPRG